MASDLLHAADGDTIRAPRDIKRPKMRGAGTGPVFDKAHRAKSTFERRDEG